MLTTEARSLAKEARLKNALARLSQYQTAKKLDAVKAQLLAKGVAKATINNWIRNPPSIGKAYRWQDFVDAVEKLPDLEREKRNSAYDFALAELGLRPETQSGLSAYHRSYIIHHDFKDITLDTLLIRVESKPTVATFFFKYRNPDNARELCDGLIVERGGRLLLTGFSPTTVFQAFVLCTPHPERNVMRGMAFIEDLHTNEVHFSRIALLGRSVQVNEVIQQQITSHVLNSSYRLQQRSVSQP